MGEFCKLLSLLSPSLVSGAGEADATGAVAPSLASAGPVGDPPARLGVPAPGNLGSRGGYPEESPSLLSGQRLLSPGTSGCLVLPRCLSPPPSTLTLHSQ